MSDIHQDTATELGVSRRVAKTINYGKLYGNKKAINLKPRTLVPNIAIQTEMVKLHKEALESWKK